MAAFQVIATFIYAVIGYAGYLMFGSRVSDEVSFLSCASCDHVFYTLAGQQGSVKNVRIQPLPEPSCFMDVGY